MQNMATQRLHFPLKLLNIEASGISNFALRLLMGYMVDDDPTLNQGIRTAGPGLLRIPIDHYDDALAELCSLGYVCAGKVSMEPAVDKGLAERREQYLVPYISVPVPLIADQRLSCGAFRALLFVEARNRITGYQLNRIIIGTAVGKSRHQVDEYMADLKRLGYLKMENGGEGDRGHGWRWEYKVSLTGQFPKWKSAPKVIKVDSHVINETMFAAGRRVLKRMVPPDWGFYGKAERLAWALERVGTDYKGCHEAEGLLRDQLPVFFDDPSKAGDEFWRIADAAYREHRAQQKVGGR